MEEYEREREAGGEEEPYLRAATGDGAHPDGADGADKARDPAQAGWVGDAPQAADAIQKGETKDGDNTNAGADRVGHAVPGRRRR